MYFMSVDVEDTVVDGCQRAMIRQITWRKIFSCILIVGIVLALACYFELETALLKRGKCECEFNTI